MPYAMIPSSAPSASFAIKFDDDGRSWSEVIRQRGGLSASDVRGKTLCTVATVVGARKTLPPIFSAQYLYAVNKAIKEEIETEEPNVHEFLPFEISLRSDEWQRPEYFLMAVGNLIDAIDPARTNLRRDTRRYSSRNVFRDASLHLTLRSSAVEGKAVWYDVNFTEAFVSDRLGAVIQKQKASTVKLWPVAL